ncbi:MAG: Ig-like domain-containing protein, partial [Campylobacteraceae bacterium]|nr:Ig-like domain-containing protein [Campylobacteraceae bacterium]
NTLINLENIIKNKKDSTSIISHIKKEELKINVEELNKKLNKKIKAEDKKLADEKKAKDLVEDKKLEKEKAAKIAKDKKEAEDKKLADEKKAKDKKLADEKKAPIISNASYSNTSSTSRKVIVTFTSDDDDLITPISWVKDGNTFKKSFSSNTNETVGFINESGNKTDKNILITNIYNPNDETFTFNGKDYKKVNSSKTTRTWLDRNLGASEVCNNTNNTQCSGDYFQWGRKANGHEKINSTVSTEEIDEDSLNNDSFINNMSAPFTWRNTKDDTLWLGNNAINSICPDGYRVPSKYELEAEFTFDSTKSPLNNILKIPLSSFRKASGKLDTSNHSYLWTSDTKSTIGSFDAIVLKFDNKITYPIVNTILGIPVRCIKEYEDNVKAILISIKSGNIELTNNSNNISTTEDITLVFSEDIRFDQATGINLILKKVGRNQSKVKYSNKIVTFYSNFGTFLDHDSTYTLTITSGIKDIYGNSFDEKIITFKTEATPDTTLPMIDYSQSTFDKDSSHSKNKDVSINAPIIISFNELIKVDTINKTNISINNVDNYTLKINDDKKSFTITFDDNLDYSTNYDLTLNENITDLAGNKLNGSNYSSNASQSKTIVFQTIDQPDINSPEIASYTPDSSADISIDANIIIVFTEGILSYAFNVILKDSLNTIIETNLIYMESTNTLTINPKENLIKDMSYTLTLRSGITDKALSPNNLSQREITFTPSIEENTFCKGKEIDGVCYEVSTEKLAWNDAKEFCKTKNMSLVQKDSISDWVSFASKDKMNLKLEESKSYWLNYTDNNYNILKYNAWLSPNWKISTASETSEKHYICKKDSIAPSLELIKPQSIDSISTKTKFKILFTEDVQNVNNANIILVNNSNSNIIQIDIEYTNRLLTITPQNDLDISNSYTLTIKSGITDLYSNKLIEKSFNFTTSDGVSTCDGYLSEDNICYKLSEDKKTWTDAKAFCENINMSLITKDTNTNWKELDTNLELKKGSYDKYWLNEKKDKNNSLVLKYSQYSQIKWQKADYSIISSYNFICMSDQISPLIKSSTPSHDDVDVSTKASINLTFNKEIKNHTNNISLLIDGSDSEITKTITYNNKVLTIKPSENFTTSTKYRVILNSGITDLYGNALNEKIITFTTSDAASNCDGYEENEKCYYLFKTKIQSYSLDKKYNIPETLNWIKLSTTLQLDPNNYYYIGKFGYSTKKIRNGKIDSGGYSSYYSIRERK